MKHRNAAVQIMNSISEIERVCKDLMVNLAVYKSNAKISEDESNLVTKTILATLNILHSELVEAVVKEHPDLIPACKECSGQDYFEGDATDKETN
ncbi:MULTISPECIES: hypothetical protein [unclassified Pantoea]|uniref:hypothetical protein n=1 Tax=unclassified Pantoea TaxID=2630326 RepID=UPI001CD65640|nr:MULTISPECIES: hypothetical protein [unclassified Pantoea]MCA1176672.1 hypothetical protein [Pantoea sp. alder69]MCA1251585.1 hypothetical protein [Pantoea sp. alder70]MCA1264284.1 hypothetical protein [Pantoea sp. alder81]